MFNVSIAEQKKSDAFVTPQRLPVDYQANFTSINAEVMGNIERRNEISCETLIFWGVQKGSIQPAEFLDGTYRATISESIIKRVDFKGGNQAKLECHPCDLESCSFKQSDNLKLVMEGKSRLLMWLADKLYCSLPKRDLKVGDIFVVEMPMYAGVKFPATVSGVVQILNTSALKIILEKRFSKDDFNTFLQATGKELVQGKASIVSSDFRESDFDEDTINAYKKAKAAEEKKLQAEQNEPPELVHKTVLYLDLETGLTIRREDMSLLKENSSFSVFQIS